VTTDLFNIHKASSFIYGISSELLELFICRDRWNDELI